MNLGQPHQEGLDLNSGIPNFPPTTPRPQKTSSPTMNGEDPQERPEQIRSIINGLERYNPQAAEVLEAYLQQQCEEKFCDCNANRALLKL